MEALMRFGRLIPCFLLTLATAGASQPANAPFRSVELRSGGEVIIRPGAAQRVETLSGSPEITVAGGGRLNIDNRHGPHEPRTRIAITTPSLDAVSVDDGGKLIVERGFPAQTAVTARVGNGGMLDLRRLAVRRVAASVSQGGIIFVRAEDRLDASISQGGNITYWGNPSVKSSVRQGGAVARGDVQDLEKTL
jgi:hypothetical protein